MNRFLAKQGVDGKPIEFCKTQQFTDAGTSLPLFDCDQSGARDIHRVSYLLLREFRIVARTPQTTAHIDRED